MNIKRDRVSKNLKMQVVKGEGVVEGLALCS